MFDPADPEQQRFKAYGPAPIPDPRDEEVRPFVDSLVAGGPRRFAEVKSLLNIHGKRVLHAYAERMASAAVRTHNQALLDRALVALVIAGLDENDKDCLMTMAPIDDSARRIGADIEELFERVAKIVGHQGTVSLVLWLSRKPENRSLECMRFVAGEDSDGFRYRLEW
jgi:hypothetical protein